MLRVDRRSTGQLATRERTFPSDINGWSPARSNGTLHDDAVGLAVVDHLLALAPRVHLNLEYRVISHLHFVIACI